MAKTTSLGSGPWPSVRVLGHERLPGGRRRLGREGPRKDHEPVAEDARGALLDRVVEPHGEDPLLVVLEDDATGGRSECRDAVARAAALSARE